jgi:hypothetical protein
MTKSLEEISEELRKYLIEVVFNGQHYFTLWGTDISDQYIDKWLLDADQRLFLFPDIETLAKSLSQSSNFHDDEKVKQWSRYLDKQSNPNYTSNFDILKDDIGHLHPSLNDLYVLIGVIEDFAIQADDSQMKALFQSDLFREFKDEAANTFVWSGQDEFNKDFDFITLNSACRKLHAELKHKINIVRHDV